MTGDRLTRCSSLLDPPSFLLFLFSFFPFSLFRNLFSPPIEQMRNPLPYTLSHPIEIAVFVILCFLSFAISIYTPSAIYHLVLQARTSSVSSLTYPIASSLTFLFLPFIVFLLFLASSPHLRLLKFSGCLLSVSIYQPSCSFCSAFQAFCLFL